MRGDKPSATQPLDCILARDAHVGSNRRQIPDCTAEMLRVQAKTCLRKHVGKLCVQTRNSNYSQRDARQASPHQQHEIYVRRNVSLVPARLVRFFCCVLLSAFAVSCFNFQFLFNSFVDFIIRPFILFHEPLVTGFFLFRKLKPFNVRVCYRFS